MVSGRAANTSSHTCNQSRLTYLNEKEKQRPNRPDPPKIARQHKGNLYSKSKISKYIITIKFSVLVGFIL